MSSCPWHIVHSHVICQQQAEAASSAQRGQTVQRTHLPDQYQLHDVRDLADYPQQSHRPRSKDSLTRIADARSRTITYRKPSRPCILNCRGPEDRNSSRSRKTNIANHKISTTGTMESWAKKEQRQAILEVPQVRGRLAGIRCWTAHSHGHNRWPQDQSSGGGLAHGPNRWRNRSSRAGRLDPTRPSTRLHSEPTTAGRARYPPRARPESFSRWQSIYWTATDGPRPELPKWMDCLNDGRQSRDSMMCRKSVLLDPAHMEGGRGRELPENATTSSFSPRTQSPA